MNTLIARKQRDSVVNNIIVAISLFVAGLVYISPKPSGYEMMFLHPLIFGLFYKVCKPLKEAKFIRASLFVLFATMIVRYVISPFSLVLGDYPLAGVNDPSSTAKGMWLMVYEEVLVFILIQQFGKKLIENNIKGNNNNGVIPLNNNIYLTGLVLFGALALLFNSDIQQRYHFIFRLTGEEYDITEKYMEVSAFFSFIINAARYVLILLLISFFYKKYLVRPSSRYPLYSLAVIGINMLWVFDISRFNLIIPSVVLAYLVIQLYPKHRGRILLVALAAGLFVVGFTTFIKMFSDARGGSDQAQEATSWASMIQMYFMGQRDVGIGVYTAEKVKGLGIYLWGNDVIGQIMFVNKYHVAEITPEVIYNYDYNQGPWVDKILPNLCAGYTYFGTLLAPIITLLYVRLALFFDFMSITSKKVQYKFLSIYGAIMCSLIMMQSHVMILNVLVNTLLLIYIIFKVNDILFTKK